MAEQAPESPASVLDRTIDLTRVSGSTLALIGTATMAALLRLPQLDRFPLSPAEARLADEAFRLFEGTTDGPINQLANTAPAGLLLNSLAFFLIGASDASARIVPVLFGLGLVILAGMLRPVVGGARAVGMAFLAAISPTLVYASRTTTTEIAVAFFSMLLVVALVRIGVRERSDASRSRWALVGGVALAAGFGSGPSFLSVLIAIAVGVGLAMLPSDRANAFARSFDELRRSREAQLFAGVGFLVTLIVLFTRVFTDFSAISGVPETFADWGRLLATLPNSTPTQFFLLSILLYEPIAVLFGIVAAVRSKPASEGGAPWTFFGGWFVAALLIFSFSSGGAPEHAVLVSLPLILLAGGELGALVAGYATANLFRGRSGLLVLVLVGLIAGLSAFLTLLGRIDSAADRTQAIFEALAALLIAVLPLTYAAYLIVRQRRAEQEDAIFGQAMLLAVAVVLLAVGIRSSVMLSFYRAADGTELLAQRTSTGAVTQIVHRVTNLSRDETLKDGSAADPEGGHGLSIAMDRRVQWPYRWYFRDFPEAAVATDGTAPSLSSDVVIAPDDSGMAEAGYAPHLYPTLNRVPGEYLAPSIGTILSHVFVPSKWQDGVDFLLFRDIPSAEPTTVAVGLTGGLANQISPNTGPFSLFDRPGAGSGRGQFIEPRGVAAAPDGSMVYVVDMGNARVQRFDAVGQFVGVWGGDEGGSLELALTEQGLGPTGIAVGEDGLIYVADTWNHRIVVLDSAGRTVREFGAFADAQDSPDPTAEPGLFFGPRAVAAAGDEIYVVDTGNERVEVFGLDGTFRRAFGGHGIEPEKMIEPVGIAIGADGRIYVADSGNARISVFSESGALQDTWPVEAWVGQQYFEPYLTFDALGNLYASSSATGSVEVFDRDGNLVESITSVGTERLQQPTGLTTALDGSVLITDKAASTVYRFMPDESFAPPLTVPDSDESSLSAVREPGAPSAASPPVDQPIVVNESQNASPGASPVAPSPTVASTAAANG